MKIQLIPEKCIACGLCHLYAPEVFDYEDDGIVKFYDNNALEADFSDFNCQDENIIQAVKKCPTRALKIN